MLLLLLLASLCLAANWAVIFSTDDIIEASCLTSRSCRLYDYLVSTGMDRKNIIFMSPKLHWDSLDNCKIPDSLLENVVEIPPSVLPYGDVCWSHLNYVGDFVDFTFLMDVLRGDKEAVMRKSNAEPVVVQADENSNIFIYFENVSNNVPGMTDRLYTKMDVKFQAMVWLTDSSTPVANVFDASVLDSGCLILNLHQLKGEYSHYVYAPNFDPYDIVYQGMWDHSWVDMFIAMSEFTVDSVYMATIAGLLQMRSPEEITVWGDESLFEMTISALIGVEPPSRLLFYERVVIMIMEEEEMKYVIRNTYFTNKNHTKELQQPYYQELKKAIRLRKRAWNSILMSETKEDTTVSLSDEECVDKLVEAYYQNCTYMYPFDNSLMQLIRSLCRFRKTDGMIVVNPSMFCGWSDLNPEKVYTLED